MGYGAVGTIIPSKSNLSSCWESPSWGEHRCCRRSCLHYPPVVKVVVAVSWAHFPRDMNQTPDQNRSKTSEWAMSKWRFCCWLRPLFPWSIAKVFKTTTEEMSYPQIQWFCSPHFPHEIGRTVDPKQRHNGTTAQRRRLGRLIGLLFGSSWVHSHCGASHLAMRWSFQKKKSHPKAGPRLKQLIKKKQQQQLNMCCVGWNATFAGPHKIFGRVSCPFQLDPRRREPLQPRCLGQRLARVSKPPGCFMRSSCRDIFI